MKSTILGKYQYNKGMNDVGQNIIRQTKNIILAIAIATI